MRFKVRATETLPARKTLTGSRIAGALAMAMVLALFFGFVFGFAGSALSQQAPVKLVVLGDSLVAGYGLEPGQAFPEKLQAALREKGHAVEIVNAGVSGDTSAGGLERLDWSVPDDTDAAIVELGANDALRGLDPATTRANLEAIVTRLRERGIAVLLAGMLAPPNMGEDYAERFNPIYADLAQAHGVALYPFFLDGVAAQAHLNLSDGMHPNPEGVDEIVTRLLPAAEALLEQASEQAGE